MRENLFHPADRARIEERIRILAPGAVRQWGKMDAAQALAHCCVGIEAATGDRPMRQKFIGKILTPFFKGYFLGPKPFSRDAPTDRSFVVADPREFAREKDRLLALVAKFAGAGPDAAARHEHAFLGRLTGEEWGRGMWKHLDHHLRQFGG